MQLSSVERAYTHHPLVKQQKQQRFVATRQSQQQRSYRGLTASPCALDRHRLQIVFLTSEVAPWSKTGGLADVLSGLPAALAARGHRVMTVSPRYGDYVDAVDSGVCAPVSLGGTMQASGSFSSQTNSAVAATGNFTGGDMAGTSTSGVLGVQVPPAQQNLVPTINSSHMHLSNPTQEHSTFPVIKYYTCHTGDGVEYVFVDHPIFHAASSHAWSSSGSTRNPPEAGVYMHTAGADSVDVQTRYSILCQAAVAAPVLLWQDFARANMSYGDQLRLHVLMQQVAQHAQVKQAGVVAQGSSEVATAMAREPSALQYGVARPVSQWNTARQQVLGRDEDEGEELVQSSAMLQASHSDSVIFVGNDWPSGLLGLWLNACKEQQGAEQSARSAEYSPEALLAYLLKQQDEQLQQLQDEEQQLRQQRQLQNEQQQQQQQLQSEEQQLLDMMQEQEELLQQLQKLLQPGGTGSSAADVVLAGTADADNDGSLTPAAILNVQPVPSQPVSQTATPVSASTSPALEGPHASAALDETNNSQQQDALGARRRVKQAATARQQQAQQQVVQPSLPTMSQAGQSNAAQLQPFVGASNSEAQQQQQQQQQAGRWHPEAAGSVPADTGVPMPVEEPKAAADVRPVRAMQHRRRHRRHTPQPSKQKGQELLNNMQKSPPKPDAAAAAQQQGQQLDERQLLQAAVEQQLLVQALQEVGKVNDAGVIPESNSSSGSSKQSNEARVQPVSRVRWQRILAAFHQLLGGPLRDAKFVFTIHNFAHQGLFSTRSFGSTGLPMLEPPQLLLTDTQQPLNADSSTLPNTDAAAVSDELQLPSANVTSVVQVPAPANQSASAGQVSSAASADKAASADQLTSQMAPDSNSMTAADMQSHPTAAVEGNNAARRRGRRNKSKSKSGSSTAVAHSSTSNSASSRQPDTVEEEALSDDRVKQAIRVQDQQQQEGAGGQQVQQQLPADARPPPAAAAAAASATPEAQSAWQALWGAAQKQATAFLSWLQAGLATSDLVVTVSPQHAQELQDQASQADGNTARTSLQQFRTGVEISHQNSKALAAIRGKGVVGIMNGVDSAVWCPQADTFLPSRLRYGTEDVHRKKAAAKALLQSRMGLRLDPDIPLFAFVGRLEEQKGADVLLAALPQLLGPPNPDMVDLRTGHKLQLTGIPNTLGSTTCDTSTGAVEGPGQRKSGKQQQRGRRGKRQPHSVSASCQLQVVMLGAGQEWQEACVTQLSEAWPGKAVGYAGFNEPLAHLIMAAADYLMVPSRFEPCGLVALCALRYGTLPIVSPVGGLLHAARPSTAIQPQPGNAARPGTAVQPGSAVQSQPGNAAQPGSAVRQGTAAVQSTASKTSGKKKAAFSTKCPSDLGFVLPNVIGSASDPGSMRASATELVDCIKEAICVYGSEWFLDQRVRCMQQDFSWDASAAAWEQALQALLSSPKQEPDSMAP